jgi:hypothetical protein
MVHEAMEEAEARKNPPQAPEDTRTSADKYFEGRTKEFLRSIPENVLRLEMEQLFSQPQPGEGWSRTYSRLEIAYARRKHERSGINF